MIQPTDDLRHLLYKEAHVIREIERNGAAVGKEHAADDDALFEAYVTMAIETGIAPACVMTIDGAVLWIIDRLNAVETFRAAAWRAKKGE